MKKNTEALKDLSLFSGFSDCGLREFHKTFRSISFKAGETVFREGADGSTFFVIISGEVAIEKKLDKAGKRYKKLASMNKGDFFGEMAVLEDRPRYAQARAVTDAELFELERSSLLEFIKKCPEEGSGMLIEIILVILKRLRHTSDELMAAHGFMEVLAKYKKK
ncbi:MAG: cyclic nucleotide-binding domain-containing protein [Elusimicrobiales bacterium]|nr:cyclic nucleotide-binding domain-containing protein [Elusimicrobiales bacterium]